MICWAQRGKNVLEPIIKDQVRIHHPFPRTHSLASHKGQQDIDGILLISIQLILMNRHGRITKPSSSTELISSLAVVADAIAVSRAEVVVPDGPTSKEP